MKSKTISSIEVVPILTVHDDTVTSTKPVLVKIFGELWRVDKHGVRRRGYFAEGVRAAREKRDAARVGRVIEMIRKLTPIKAAR